MESKCTIGKCLELIVSLVVHVALIGPTVYICLFAAQRTLNLTVLHVITGVVGCGLLMTQAVFAISGETVLFSRLSRLNRVRVHYVLHTLGVGLLIVSFASIVLNKNRNNSNHFTSDHGILGLTTFVLSLVVTLTGWFLMANGKFYKVRKPLIFKAIHNCWGQISVVLLVASLVTGCQSRWWSGSELGRTLTIIAYIVGGILVLLKPLVDLFRKLRTLFASSDLNAKNKNEIR